jgi:hypothetical protein
VAICETFFMVSDVYVSVQDNLPTASMPLISGAPREIGNK